MSRHHLLPHALPPNRFTRTRRSEPAERSAEVTGGFRFSSSEGWWWSSGMFELHGFGPQPPSWVTPSTRLLLAHRHRADREAVTDAWSHLRSEGKMVAFRYRIIGADGRTRTVFVMATADVDRNGVPIRVTGVMQAEPAVP